MKVNDVLHIAVVNKLGGDTLNMVLVLKKSELKLTPFTLAKKGLRRLGEKKSY